MKTNPPQPKCDISPLLCRLDDKVSGLEADQAKANDVITQLRHELNVKSELLHAYSADFVEASDMPSPVELKAFNVELMQRKVRDLEEDNKKLQQEATEVGQVTLNHFWDFSKLETNRDFFLAQSIQFFMRTPYSPYPPW